MKIKWNDTWLADDSSPAYGLTYNGQQIIQEAQFIQSATAALWGRGNRTVTLAFSVTRTFDTVREAEEFVVSNYGTLEDEGTLLCRCGANGEETSDVVFAAAVFVGPRMPKYRGVSVQMDYQFRAPQVTGIFPTEDDDMKSASIAIPAAVDHFTAAGLAFPTIPSRIMPHVRIPAGGENIEAHVVDGTVTADGFDIQLSGVTPDGDYILDFSYQL